MKEHFLEQRGSESSQKSLSRKVGFDARRLATLWLDRKSFAVLVAYTLMVYFAVAFYQQSEDEGGAWILARSFSVYDLVFHILRYVGHPPLYYLLLWGPAHFHWHFVDINWFFAGIATVGIYLLLRFSPFPFYLKALLPFGFALGYQYAVVARSYVLFPLLGFSVCILYREKILKPMLMACVLGLLANVSIHGTMVAIGFGFAYIVKVIDQRRQVSATIQQKRRALLGLGIFASSILFVAVCIWPVKYLNQPWSTILVKIVHRIGGPLAENSSPHGSVPLPATHPSNADTKSAPIATTNSDSSITSLPRISSLQQRIESLKLAFIFPIASASPLALLYLILVAVFLFHRHKKVLFLPILLLAYFLVFVYAQPWHSGLMWVTLLLVLWAAWDETIGPLTFTLQSCVAGLLGALCLLQLPWTVGAIHYEMHHTANAARPAAAYLKSLPSGKRIDGNYLAFVVLPYFSNYIFVDHESRHIDHHEPYPAYVSVAEFISEKADIILLPALDVTDTDRQRLSSAGYSETHSFCGAPYFPNRTIVPVCLALFERD